MKLSLPPSIVEQIEERVRSGRYKTAEDVVAAAISILDQQESLRDFAPGELDALLAEGEASGQPLDGEEVFARMKCLREKAMERAHAKGSARAAG